MDVYGYKNSISHPGGTKSVNQSSEGFSVVSETPYASEFGNSGRKKSRYIFLSTLMHIPLNIVFLSDKQATTLNCLSS